MKERGKVAFLFPGQGQVPEGPSPRCTVGERLFTAAEGMGLPLREWMENASLDRLQRTEVAQPAILIDSLAKEEVLRASGFQPAYVAGHSLGEYAALVCAGILTPEEGLTVVTERGRLMAQVEGAMAAIVRLSRNDVRAICEQIGPDVVIANYNGPTQTVVSGKSDAVRRAMEMAKTAGGHAIPLQVSGPFHSPLMAGTQSALAPMIEALVFKRPSVPMISSVSGMVETDPVRLKDLLLTQITACVRWNDVVERLIEEKVTEAVEVGPGDTLTGLGRRITARVRFMTFEEALGG